MDMAAKGRSLAQIHPERLARGDRNGARLHPERLAWGDRNGSRLRRTGAGPFKCAANPDRVVVGKAPLTNTPLC